ncbi:hypothetical protein NQ317_004197 [Molorchus minor]|uniref:Uncharacterized protein n=1 Tax=Molorchus minor TaxID=1323400 RepID=A0ABQ9JCP6_9CUCU|nr:hypothetical protein NQ317_004197 [Molorchus minor]
MYRQILISKEDRDFQRIPWRFSPHDPIQEFVLNTVMHLAEDEKFSYPSPSLGNLLRAEITV